MSGYLLDACIYAFFILFGAFAGASFEKGHADKRLNHAMQAAEQQYHEQEADYQRLSQQLEDQQHEQEQEQAALQARVKALQIHLGNRACLDADGVQLLNDAAAGRAGSAGAPDSAVPPAAGPP